MWCVTGVAGTHKPSSTEDWDLDDEVDWSAVSKGCLASPVTFGDCLPLWPFLFFLLVAGVVLVELVVEKDMMLVASQVVFRDFLLMYKANLTWIIDLYINILSFLFFGLILHWNNLAVKHRTVKDIWCLLLQKPCLLFCFHPSFTRPIWNMQSSVALSNLTRH